MILFLSYFKVSHTTTLALALATARTQGELPRVDALAEFRLDLVIERAEEVLEGLVFSTFCFCKVIVGAQLITISINNLDDVVNVGIGNGSVCKEPSITPPNNCTIVACILGNSTNIVVRNNTVSLSNQSHVKLEQDFREPTGVNIRTDASEGKFDVGNDLKLSRVTCGSFQESETIDQVYGRDKVVAREGISSGIGPVRCANHTEVVQKAIDGRVIEELAGSEGESLICLGKRNHC